jgi:hypothetical protein
MEGASTRQITVKAKFQICSPRSCGSRRTGRKVNRQRLQNLHIAMSGDVARSFQIARAPAPKRRAEDVEQNGAWGVSQRLKSSHMRTLWEKKST